MEAISINPEFNDLNKPETILKHIQDITKNTEPTPHTEILNQLVGQFEPLDFEALAFPQVEKLRGQLEALSPESEQTKEILKQLDKLKVNTKHYLVLSIENVLLIAEKKRWGLCKNMEFIYLYNGAYWAYIEKEVFQKFLGEASEKMSVAKFTARFYEFREKLIKQFISTAYLPTPEPPKEAVYINLKKWDV